MLVDLAQALGVSVESILSEETATLPKRRQEKIAEFVSAYVKQYRQGRVR